MLNYVQISNFKSLKSVGIPLGKMNLFFGMNGMGKSSVLQSLLLVRQSFWSSNQQGLNQLFLNGGLTEIGTQKDAFCQTLDKPELRFLLCFSNAIEYDAAYSYNHSNVDSDILPGRVSGNGRYEENLFDPNHFSYLSADHLPPMRAYSSINYQRDGLNPMGDKGEYIVPFLAKEGRKIQVAKRLRHPKAASGQLIDQVSAWLGTISPGVQVLARDIPQEQKAILSMRYSGEVLNTDDISPVNTGFGVSYVLPLITELLISDSRSLILIENPESHLHPKGQAEMARLLALAASNGAQIICESHSDHIINGVRVAVHDQCLNSDDVYVGYFSKNMNQETQVTDINIDSNGNLSDYPEGLLDEWGIQMARLL